ncbi:hypothetical protein FRC10_002797 [Ceratobasidium sp. 414]|nr:hypothetical protein FRC10_002797 [Ceratobasidium sp. 414]
MARTLWAAALVAGSLFTASNAFYLPGTAPHDYHKDDAVPLYVNALTPMVIDADSKLKSMINYDYYHPGFHFCEPKNGVWKQPESLGSILFGDRIFNSPIEFKMLRNESCTTICTATVPAEGAKFINDRIREDYALNWLVDGLPAAEMKQDERTGETFYDMGFNLGENEKEEFKVNPALFNHYDILLNIAQGGTSGCGAAKPPPLILSEDKQNSVTYTYSINWQESDTPWATRWDNYLHIFDPKIHWFSLINSLVIVIFLCVMVSMILVRTVSRDVRLKSLSYLEISRYNAIDLSEDVQEDFGWKLVHGEVFRSPRSPLVLSVLVGNGAQLSVMVGVTLVFALLGFLSPSNRGSLATVMIVFWTFFGSVGGYVSARVYASLGGAEQKKNAFLTATVLPAFVFGVMFLLNLFLIGAGSSGAVPLGCLASRTGQPDSPTDTARAKVSSALGA